MSHTLELLTNTEVHGTPDGYRAGCTGSAASCPGEITCTDAFTRYNGDWSFRKRVNAGEHPAAIFREEEAQAAAVRARDIAAARADRKRDAEKAREVEQRKRQKSTLATRKRATKPPRPRRESIVDVHGDKIRALHSEGLNDPQIADTLGLPATTVHYVRSKVLHLPANARASATRRKARVAALHAEGMTDQQIADILGTQRSVVWQVRTRLGLPVNSAERAPQERRSVHDDRVRELHAQGLTDAQIGERAGISKAWAAELRRALGLHPNRRVKPRPAPAPTRVLQPHGTNACWARGCRRPECVEAHREYHREYRNRRAAEGAEEYHGTAYGYQLGCRGRACAATPTCTEAMLEQERARRRAAGVPAKDLVDAAPVRAHVQDLHAAGMTYQQVAEAAGVPFTAVKSLMFSRGAGRPRVEQMLAERAAAILAVSVRKAVA